MDRAIFYHSDTGSTFSSDSYQRSSIASSDPTPISPNQLRQEDDDNLKPWDKQQRPLSSKPHSANYRNLTVSGSVKSSPLTQKFQSQPQPGQISHFNSIPRSSLPHGGSGAQLRRNPYKKGSGGNLTKKLLMSGISRIAIPSRKGKDDVEMHIQFGTVLVLHLQCKNISILTLGALDPFYNLKNLYLYKNNIRRMQGLDFLCNLELLDLSRNNVERIDNLDKCKKLKKLYLGFNEIQVVEGLEELKDLEELQIDDQDIPPEQPLIFSPGIMASVSHSLISLDISSNQIASLAPLANLPRLDTLDASNNCLTSTDEVVSVLQTLYQLRNLSLKGNPLAKKPSYKSSIIGAVYRLELLDDKEINDTTRSCVQKLCQMKEHRTRQKEKAEHGKMSSKSNHQMDDGNPSDFNFSTPTRHSPLQFPPPPKPFKLTRKVPSVPSTKSVAMRESLYDMEKTGPISSKPSIHNLPQQSSSLFLDRSMFPVGDRRSTIQASEFKDDFTLDHDDDGMSDMAKIIFRLSNLDEFGAGEGSGDAKSFHTNYWDLPGTSMLQECRPLSPLEGLDLALPLRIPQSVSSPELSGPKLEEKKHKPGGFRPKPAAPGGRRCSNNPTTKSASDFTRLEDDFLAQSQSYVYGRTLSPLVELPTPESLTARDENN